MNHPPTDIFMEDGKSREKTTKAGDSFCLHWSHTNLLVCRHRLFTLQVYGMDPAQLGSRIQEMARLANTLWNVKRVLNEIIRFNLIFQIHLWACKQQLKVKVSWQKCIAVFYMVSVLSI